MSYEDPLSLPYSQYERIATMLNKIGLGYDAVDTYDRDWGAREGLAMNQGVIPSTRNYPIAAKQTPTRLGWNVPEGFRAPYKPNVVHIQEGLPTAKRQDVLNHELRHSSLDRLALPPRTEEYVNRRADQEYTGTPALKSTAHALRPMRNDLGALPQAEIEYQKYRNALGDKQRAVQGQYIPGTAPTDVIRHEMKQQNLRAVAPEGWSVHKGGSYHPALSEQPAPRPAPQVQQPAPRPAPQVQQPSPRPSPMSDTLGYAEADAARKQYGANPAAARDQMVQSGQLFKQGNTYSTRPFK